MLVKISVNVQEKRKLWAKNMLEKAIYKKKPLKKRAGTGKKIGFYLKFKKKI